MRVLVITGAPGSGKTSLLEALMGLLEAEDVAYAAVDVEALALMHPSPDDDPAYDHLAYVAESFRRRGSPRLLVSATVEDAEDLNALLDALPPGDVTLVRLEAPPALLRDRIARREPPGWVGLPRLLDAAEEIAAATAALPGVDLVLDTADQDPDALAAIVRDTLEAR